MTDLAPLDPCPYSKRGDHHAGMILPESSDGYLTWYCEACGAMRRVPASGAIQGERLDDLSGAEIAALFGAPGTEYR